MKRTVLTFFFVLCFALLQAQVGNYFLSHYTPDDELFDNVCFDMGQDTNGILYFATKRGVLQFDGRSWDLINCDGAVYTMQVNSPTEMFWGGATGFGKVWMDETGAKKTKTLSEKNVVDIFQSVAAHQQIYFLNANTIFNYKTTSQSITQIKSTPLTGSFTGIFELFNKVYVNTERGGVFQIEENIISKASLDGLEKSEIIFSSKGNNIYLIGTQDHLYKSSVEGKFEEVVLQAQDYTKASVVISGLWVNNQLAALGTLRGGIIFIDQNGQTKEIVNYNAGLPDNEVFCMMADQNQNVWVAHDYGFTRVAPGIPLHSFSHYDGLQGNVLCALTFNQQVYVGTSLGLFRLQKEEIYDEITYYVSVKVKEKQKGKSTKTEVVTKENQIVETAESESKKKGFLWFLRRNKNKDKEKIDVPSPDVANENGDAKSVEKKAAPVYRQDKRTQRILRSSNYVYKKVEGINAKVSQLLKVNDRLLAIGLVGAHEVTELQAKPILEEPARFAFANSNFLLVSTYDNEIRSWNLHESNWQRTNQFDNLDDEINFIFDGKENEIWFCSHDRIYRMESSDGEVKNIKAINLPNGNFNESVGLVKNKEVLIINGGGFFRYAQNNQFEKIDSLSNPKSYFVDGNNVWYRDEHHWRALGSNLKQRNLQLLNLFPDLRFISLDEKMNNLWLITSNNELYSFAEQEKIQFESNYPLLVKSVRNGDRMLPLLNKIKIEESQSSLSVEVVNPEYLGVVDMEYRYFLKGLHKEWSDWASHNKVIDFPYLPMGNYSLIVQSKDIFGNVKEMKTIPIQVRQPYWQRPWFYAIEVALFACLVIASFRLSKRYSIISRILSLITIILLIQFIETVATISFSTKSPVIDFFIQVGVAFLILPFEGFLRKFMLKTSDHSIGISKLIKEKKDKDV